MKGSNKKQIAKKNGRKTKKEEERKQRQCTAGETKCRGAKYSESSQMNYIFVQRNGGGGVGR